MNLIWNRHTRSLMLRLVQMLPIRRRSVMCVCWGGEQWNCNPRAIVERLVGSGEWGVAVAFRNPEQFRGELPEGVEAVEIGSLRYFRLLATSQFIIANTRFGGGMWWPFPKRRGQFFIQTQHGGHGIKKVEFDAQLPADYLKAAMVDTELTDLMLSDSRYWTNVYRTSYRYHGQVLELGLPRNDSFFADTETIAAIKTRAVRFLTESKGSAIPEAAKFLIYTPTFRNNGRKDVYGFDADKMLAALSQRFGGEWYVLVSSHPNMRSYYREIYDFSHPRTIDVGTYPELQDLLLVSDALITDYSSAEMDFTLRTTVTAYRQAFPVFQLCRDRHDYDRGFYINPEDLPFPYATTDAELIQNILSFDDATYLRELERFNREVIGLCETGHAAEAVVRWMAERCQ